jgi:arginyl-tRNA synthetase
MIEDTLRELVADAIAKAAGDLGLAEVPLDLAIEIDAPRNKAFGDFSTNVALALARPLGRPPRAVAEAIAAAIPASPALAAAPEIAGAGFINFRVTHDWLREALRDALGLGERYGRAPAIGRRAQVEFVSANPTGPLHVGHARNAALGDAVARVLEAGGWTVEREYYFNDAGGQMDRFAASVEARYLQRFGREAAVPEDGYHGDYLIDVAAQIADEHGVALLDLPEPDRRRRLGHEGSRRILDGIATTMRRFGVRFDSYRSERELAESGAIAAAIERLRAAGYVYQADGATWFQSTSFGDDKDRVLIRANGAHTYFAADCAYLVDKFSRGFDRLLYVWGADHHGDVVRVTGAAEAMGYDASSLEIVLYQFVSFLRGGEPVSMSKRAGAFLTLDALIDEVGTDAARFTLLAQSNDSTMRFDIDAVRRQSMDNPVFYVQYGHARIASILRVAASRGIGARAPEHVDLSLLRNDAELDLMRAVAELPGMVRVAADLRAPYKLTHYAQQLAAAFHRFYTECPVLGEDAELTQARLCLCAGAKLAIRNVLALLGVSAPESMERDDGA